MKSDLTYLWQLVEAGWDGALSVRKKFAVRPPAPVPTGVLLGPAAIGASIGALSASLRRTRRSGSSVATAALIGGAVGLGAGAAWASRSSAEAAARAAIRKINAARDTHWLERHPIAYG